MFKIIYTCTTYVTCFRVTFTNHAVNVFSKKIFLYMYKIFKISSKQGSMFGCNINKRTLILCYVKAGPVVLEKKTFTTTTKKIDSWKTFNIFKINLPLRGSDGVSIKYSF